MRSRSCGRRPPSPASAWNWIKRNGPGADVILSHPGLCATGLDFFDKHDWSFNFATIVFYEMDYQTNLIRQAGRRHWRIGQPKECRTYYFYYKGTMQERQVKLVGEKFAAARSLEGKFSEEGLASQCSGVSEQMALAKSLDEKIADVRGSWAKLTPAQQKVIRASAETIVALAQQSASNPDAFEAARFVGQQVVGSIFAGEPLTQEELDELDDDDLELLDKELLDDDLAGALAKLGISLDDDDDLDDLD